MLLSGPKICMFTKERRAGCDSAWMIALSGLLVEAAEKLRCEGIPDDCLVDCFDDAIQICCEVMTIQSFLDWRHF